MSAIFGGSKSKSTSKSYNQAYSGINTALSPLLNQSAQAGNTLNAFLGGDASGFDAFKRGTSFNFDLLRGIDAIGADRASKGVFRSGARDKAIQQFGTNLQGQYAQQYINALLGQGGQGIQAANTIAGAGGVSQGTSTSKSKPGMSNAIGGGLSLAAASDPRLKTDVTRISSYGDIGLYTFKYIGQEDSVLHLGVMADEVKEKYPEALGPEVNGYMTVHYGKLKELVEG